MNAIQRVQNDQDGEFSFVEFWWVVWDHKILVGVVTAVCIIIALVMAIIATPIFRATVVVTEVRESGLSADSALAGGLGGLASVAGLGLGLNAIHPERAATLRSRHLVEEFVKQPDVLPLLTVAKKDEAAPSLWLTVERFRKNSLDIQDDKLKGTTTVTMDWTDPEVARRWADEFVAMSNQLLRQKAIDDASRNVAYLSEQLEHTTSVEIQKVMYRLIEQETRTLMLAKGRVEYAFAVVDPAVKAEVRVSPRRTLMVISGLLVGLILGSTIAWVRERFARHRVPKPTVTGG